MSTVRGLRPRCRAAWYAAGHLHRMLCCSAGVSAVEFALLAPVLVIGAFGTADAGMAVHERMMIGQALRAGAERAMAGADEARIREALAVVASDNFTVSWDGDPEGDAAPAGTLVLDVETYCACPGAEFTELSCTGTCASAGAPARFYRLSASKLFNGVILPEFAISGTVEVLAE